MIRAGALSYVVAVSVFIALILASLITLGYYYRLHHIQLEHSNRLVRNANSGFNLLLSGESLGRTASQEVDLFEEGRDSVRLITRHWGVFEVGTAIAHHRGKEASKSGLIGYLMDSTQRTALYLSELNRPLSLAGNTLIKGNCFLPEAGVKRAYIEGQNFSRKKLIDGLTKRSDRHLPSLNVKVTSNLSQWLSDIRFGSQEMDSELNGGSDEDESQRFDSVANPFSKPTRFLEMNLIDGVSLSGNIVVTSTGTIRITAQNNLRDIIVIAPRVYIEKGFEGNLQIIAKEQVVVEPQCNLQFPSVILLDVASQQSTTLKDELMVQIGEESLVNGEIMIANLSGAAGYASSAKTPLLKMERESIIHGQAYVDGRTELHGKIFGSLYTNKFYLKTPSSIYENHLLNGEINIDRRSRYYIGTDLVMGGLKAKYKVIKWLY